MAVQRAALIYTGLRAEGTVVAKRPTGSTPVKYGAHVTVLYRQDHPESARMDDAAALWTGPPVAGVVGTGLAAANRVRCSPLTPRRTL